MLKISLLRLLWNNSRIVLMAIILTTTTFKYVEARDHPVLFPYSTGGLSELKAFVSERRMGEL